MPFATVNNIRFYYEHSGTGPRLLFVSGTAGDLRQRPRIIDGVLRERFEVLAYDQRGLGQTDKPDQTYTMSDYAEDAAALLDFVGWDTCHVLGVSFGGMVAQELALRYPHLIDRLVLACTSSGGDGGESFPLHELEFANQEEFIRALVQIRDTRWTKEWLEKLTALTLERSIKPATATEAKALQRGLRLQLDARKYHDTWSRLPQLQCPVYLCGGLYDGITPVANMERLATRIPNSKLEFFEGGHGFLFEAQSAHTQIANFIIGQEED